MPQSGSSHSASKREEESGAVVPYGQESAQQSSQSSSTSRPSRMQVARPGQRYDEPSSRPSRMQVALPGQLYDYDEPSRSSIPGRPSQMQVALPTQRDPEPRRAKPASSRTVRADESYHSSRPPPALPSIREAESSRYGPPSRESRNTRPTGQYRDTAPPAASTNMRKPERSRIEPTRNAVRPQLGATRIVRPGEPHHFGSRTDYERGEVHCTLCRCNNPSSHKDAYTMLNSPRGFDIHGNPIDWQEAKQRMLDYHGKNQISHAEEVAAIPYVYDAATAREALKAEEELKESARQGFSVEVNVSGNNVNWHNDDGHAKPYLTKEGAKTRFNPDR